MDEFVSYAVYNMTFPALLAFGEWNIVFVNVNLVIMLLYGFVGSNMGLLAIL